MFLFGWLTAAAGATPAPDLSFSNAVFITNRTDLCLPSGLRILYHQEPHHPTVTWTTVIGSGSVSDPPGKEGLAHLVEHLWFRSTPRRASVWQEADAIGASINGSTRPDDTRYPTAAPASALPQVVELEAARLTRPLQGVSPEVFDTEREVVRAELRWRYENSSGSGYLALLGEVFDEGHPYHRPGIGTHASLDATTLGAAQAWAASHYVPENTTWMITAPLSAEDFRVVLAERLPESMFAGASQCSEQDLPTAPLPEPRQRDPVTVEAYVQSPQALIGWALPAGLTRGDAQIQRVTALLQQAMWRVNARCYSRAMVHATLVYCRLGVPEDEPEARVAKALDQVYLAWDNANPSWSERRFQRQRSRELSDLFRSVESLTASHSDAAYVHHTGDLDQLTSWLRDTLDATQHADAAFASKWLDQRRAVSVILTPREEAPDSVPHAEGRAPASSVPTQELDDSMLSGLDTSTLRKERLPNGLEVWVYPYGRAPFARATLVMDGGWALAPSRAVESQRNASTRSLGGVLDDTEMAYIPVRVGGDWFVSVNATTLEYGIRGAAGSLEALLYLLRKRMDHMVVRPEMRREVQRDLEEQLWSGLERASVWAAMERATHLVGEHGWDPELPTASPKEVRAWSHEVVRPTGSTLIIVGRVDPDEAIAHAKTWWASFQDRGTGQPHQRRLQPAPSRPRQIVVLDEPARIGAAVHLACPVGPTDHEGLAARQVLSTTLDTLVQGRLRGQLGATYGVSAWTEALPTGDAALHVTTDVTSPAAATAVQSILHPLTVLRGGKAGQRHIAGARRTLIRKSVLGLRDSREVSNRLRAARRSGHGVAVIDESQERLAAVDTAAVAGLLETCVGHEVVTVQGPVGELREAIETLMADGHPVRVLDWEAERDAWMKEHAPKRWRRR
ncbi:MAG: insulinase family protein [Myxococcales bacterium]|nr:insulinase family protein [Myxococcales bacterium]